MRISAVRQPDFVQPAPAFPAPAERPAVMESADPPDRIPVRTGGRLVFVRPADIDWCESAGNYVKLHLGTATLVIRDTLANIERRLATPVFARIHRRLVINLERVAELRPWTGGDQIVVLRDGQHLRLSRTFRKSVTRRLLVTP